MKKTRKFVISSVVNMDQKDCLPVRIIMVYYSSTRHSRLRTYTKLYLRAGNSVLSIPLPSRRKEVANMLHNILIALHICQKFMSTSILDRSAYLANVRLSALCAIQRRKLENCSIPVLLRKLLPIIQKTCLKLFLYGAIIRIPYSPDFRTLVNSLLLTELHYIECFSHLLENIPKQTLRNSTITLRMRSVI